MTFILLDNLEADGIRSVSDRYNEIIPPISNGENEVSIPVQRALPFFKKTF